MQVVRFPDHSFITWDPYLDDDVVTVGMDADGDPESEEEVYATDDGEDFDYDRNLDT